MARKRNDSVVQLNKVLPIPIQLDGTEEVDNRLGNITNVIVGDHHVISGETGPSFVAWAVKIVINDLTYGLILVYKRYTEMEVLRNKLRAEFPDTEIPELPAKDSLSVGRLFGYHEWLEKRRKGLQWFLSNVLLNPRFQKADVVKEFIFGK